MHRAHRHGRSKRAPAIELTFVLIALVCALGLRLGSGTRAEADAWTRVSINGQLVPVSFNDGDSFRVRGGPYSGTQCRLGGFNTLESVGPVHQWGAWHPYELYIVAKMALRNARRGSWHCGTDGNLDAYGRLLMDCPDLAISQIRQGFAIAYMVDDHPSRPEYIRAQQEAIAERRGMWAHGVPDSVMTSVHSRAEDVTRSDHYNRSISTHDGHSEPYRHRDRYSVCEWVCNDEVRADERAVSEVARELRADTAIGPLIASEPNYRVLEYVRRYARLSTLPSYLEEPARQLVETYLANARSAGRLGQTRTERGSCMLAVPFDRWFGRERASCLRGHGTVPPGTNLSH